MRLRRPARTLLSLKVDREAHIKKTKAGTWHLSQHTQQTQKSDCGYFDSQAVSVAKRTVAAPPEHSVVIDGDGDGLLAVVPAAKREPHTQKWRNALETNINISHREELR